MQSNSTEPLRSNEAEQYQQYRSLSFSAVVTLVFGVISLPAAFWAHMNPFMLVFPFIGTLLGLFSFFKLRNRTDEFTGLGLSKTGLMMSLVFLFGGTGFAAYVYATEVPDGYQRISFTDLQPDPKHPELPYSPVAEELTGQKIFVKGYVYPDDRREDIKRFILVPDMGTCCFGGQPKLTDMVEVTLEDPLRVNYSMIRKSLAGEFHLGAKTTDKLGNVIYHLHADYVK